MAGVRELAPVTAVYALVLLLTRPFYLGDTSGYAIAVLSQERGLFHSYPNNFWDFGHLLWRPWGWVAYQLVGRHLAYAKAGEELLAICAGMIGLNAAAGLFSVLLVHSLVGRLVQGFARFAVSLLFLSFYAFLNYAHSGTAYVPGLMFTVLGLWLLVRAVERGAFGLIEISLCGAAFAAAVLLWVPLVLSIPAALLLAFLWPRLTSSADAKLPRLRLLLGTLLISAFIVAAVYGAVLAHMHLHSLGEVKAWIAASGHGWSQGKRLVRLVSGLPRSFLFMGEDTIALKRFVLKDPYAPTSLLELVRTTLWKLALFYAFAAALFWALLKSRIGRTIAVVLAVAFLPVLVFALFIFEPGSPERYMSLYPFVALALACALTAFPKPRAAQWVLAVFLIVTIVTNQVSLSRGRMEGLLGGAAERAGILKDRVTADGLVALATQHDDLYDFNITLLFHPLNRRGGLPLYEVVPLATEAMTRWKSEFARRSLACLQHGQSVWISRRLLAERPRPEWKWTEGDDPRISWRELPPFFRQFEFDESIGGIDGFLKLAPSPENRRLLRDQAG